MPKQFKGIAGEFVNAIKKQFIGMGAEPNNIIVQDLFNYSSPQQSPYFSSTSMRSNVLDEYKTASTEERNILSTLLSIYKQIITDKREILTQSRRLYSSDIIQTVIDVMIDDGFNSFQNEEEEFKIEYVLDDDDLKDLGEEFQTQVQELIDNFVEKFALKTRVAEIVPELLRDGEYAFGVLFDEKNKKGITEIVDDFDVINLLPFYENGKLLFVINQNNLNQDSTNPVMNFIETDDNKPVAYKADNIVFFRLNGNTKFRINMSNRYSSEFRKTFYEKTHLRLPKYVRTALPIYFGAMPLLNRLRIMENVSTVLDLNDVLKPEIVHVTVPTNTSPIEAEQIINDYERHLNEVTGIIDTDNLDLNTLAASANRRKVLPQWLDTKGQLSSAGINQAAKGQNAWDSVDKLRNLIALSIGIPPFFINLSGNAIGKAEAIKVYSRYTKKLTSLQKTLADGIKDFIMIHLQHCGMNINRNNLSVKFKALTSADALDDTDLILGLVTAISEMYENLNKITDSDKNHLVMDDEQFKAFFDRCTSSYLNISNLIRIDEDKFENIEGEDGGTSDDGFTPDFSSPSPSRSEKSSNVTTNVNINTDTDMNSEQIDKANAASYDSFVADSVDIGIPGVETNTEEI